MDSIRVSSLNKKIEVNDEGECIVLPFSDQEFPSRFYNMIDGFTELKKEIETVDKELTDREIFDKLAEVHKKAKADVDALIGANTCKKVFGDIVPSIDMIIELFEKLMPYFNDYSKERKKEINKRFKATNKKKV